MKVTMTSSPSIPSQPKASVVNVILKRLVLVILLVIAIRYAVFDLSYAMSGILGTIDNSQSKDQSYEEKFAATQETIQRETKVLSLESLHQGTYSPAKNYSYSGNAQRRSEELKKIIAKDKIASKNKGVYLPLNDETSTTVHHRNEERKQQINNVCATKNLTKTITLENMKKIKAYTNVAVDDKHKLLYCYVPKVGCTSWKVKLSLMSDKATGGSPVLNTHPSPVDSRGGLAKYGIKMLSTYTPEQIKYRLENYFKFIFVRHPMERLVSAYRSKFEKRKDNKVEYPWFYGTYGKGIRNVARKNKSDTRSDITFEEFITYVIHRSGMNKLTGDHWEQYNKICHLCLINYDFIGKFDSGMVDDISYTLRKISSLETDYWFPNVTAPRSATKYLEKYFGSIPKSLVDGVEEGYGLDFELFGFHKGLSSKLNKTS